MVLSLVIIGWVKGGLFTRLRLISATACYEDKS